MSKGVLPDDRLVSLDEHACNTRNETADRTQFWRVDVRSQRRGNHCRVFQPPSPVLFQSRISRSFAQAIDRAFNLPGSGFDGGKAVGDRQTEIIVTVVC